ncbi:tRNA pseudouridine synthase A [Candidatus Karelsulcia muelleri]|uniref:tRNA pseudouridine synthase A n=1 Tax=Candidatus Karelsulcia muelleri TaxID=336810 RepID=UPI00194F0B49|nr:tRNA pseudouridine synthase A [Candidatus Karelsulcia muelleri]
MRYFLELSFNGKYFSGWQIQKNQISIQETIEKCLSLILRKTIPIVGASRTDSGVNALQMFAHFDYFRVLKKKTFLKQINFILPSYILIKNLISVKPKANARFDVISRHYQYRINIYKGPFSSNYFNFPFLNLNFGLIKKAVFLLKRIEDFRSFGKDINCFNKCKLYSLTWKIRNRVIYIDIIANRFLRNMVRRIIGVCLYIGIRKINLLEFFLYVKSKTRLLDCPSVPAKGLYLVRIIYPKNIFNF